METHELAWNIIYVLSLLSLGQASGICRQNLTTDEIVSRYLPNCSSCKNRCGSVRIFDNREEYGCSCDSTCLSYRDCCPDFASWCPLEAGRRLPTLIPDQPVSCRTIWGSTRPSKNYLFVEFCKKNMTACGVSRDSPNSIIPVWDPERRLHFVNLNCAVCNEAKSVVPWDTILTCNKEDVPFRQNISETVTKKEYDFIWKRCQLDVVPKQNEMFPPRICVPSMFLDRPCSLECEGTNIETLCKTKDTAYLEAPMGPFTNLFCLLCSMPDEDMDRILAETHCHVEAPDGHVIPPGSGHFSFQLLFDVDLRRGFTVGEDSNPWCPVGQLWVADENRCRVSYSNIENKTIDELIIIFEIQNETFTPEMIKNIKEISLQLSPYIERNDVFVLNNVTVALTFFTTNATSISKEAVENATKSWFPTKEINIIYLNHHKTAVKCDDEYQEYKRWEYEFESNNNIRILNSKRTVSAKEFRILSNFSIAVCPEPIKWEGLTARSIVTIVFVSLSILSLVTRLIFHCLWREQGPARLQVCLVVSLLIAMTSFLLNPLVFHVFQLCYAVAVLIHWAFMAAFCWMTMIGLDILLMFKATSDFQRIGQGNKKLAMYSIYAWGFPTLLSVISIVLDHSSVDSIWQPAYATKLCWISGRLALLILFVGPVALQVFINIILFIACRVYLHKHKMSTGNISQQRQRFWLHVRLLILMGLTWVTGFLAIPLNSDALWYVFIVLNASQGVFLLVVYILANRTRQKMAELVNFRHLSSNVPGTGSTSASSKT